MSAAAATRTVVLPSVMEALQRHAGITMWVDQLAAITGFSPLQVSRALHRARTLNTGRAGEYVEVLHRGNCWRWMGPRFGEVTAPPTTEPVVEVPLGRPMRIMQFLSNMIEGRPGIGGVDLGNALRELIEDEFSVTLYSRALTVLLTERYIGRTPDSDGRYVFHSIKPYRTCDDPLSGDYLDKSVPNLTVVKPDTTNVDHTEDALVLEVLTATLHGKALAEGSDGKLYSLGSLRVIGDVE